MSEDTSEDTKAQIVQILSEEGGGPIGSIHSAPCTWTEGHARCNCLEVIAQRIVDEVIQPAAKTAKTNA